jgi:hypothetical protein
VVISVSKMAVFEVHFFFFRFLIFFVIYTNLGVGG